MKRVRIDHGERVTPTTNKHLIRWVEKMANLTQPDHIHWIDGSPAEYNYLCDVLVAAGTFFPLNEKLWPGLLLRPFRRQRRRPRRRPHLYLLALQR